MKISSSWDNLQAGKRETTL